ncbi:hypothetical protein JTB14_002506 [Gonioctena quinquepunctata]|nr:hypothetical protein JTB14_002506 [Gonioctena quinquepunctata]
MLAEMNYPDILRFSETWYTNEEISLVKLDGYDLAASFCRKTISGVGVAIFIKKTMLNGLSYHNLTNAALRYNSCHFVMLILRHIGDQINLDNDVWDMIEGAMLERTSDPKSSIRLQAVMALRRLQDPTNPECPVIKAFLSLIVDSDASIRAEVVKSIAPSRATLPHIVNRLKDVEGNVRLMVFRRCANLGPIYFKIVQRQFIIRCGVSENVPKIKKTFRNYLLSKWLDAFEDNYGVFLKALKLDADENDIVITEDVSRDVMNLLFGTIPLRSVINNLFLDGNKLIPVETLCSEAVNLWNITVSYMRNNEELDEYLDQLIPELSSFCTYIDSILHENNNKNMEDWEFLSYQYILHNLFEIVEGYDFSDEVGRKNLYTLLLKIIKEQNLLPKVKKQIISLAAQLVPKNDDFTSIICHIISEIREPSIEKVVDVDPAVNTDLACQKAQLREEIIKLDSELEDATDRKGSLRAADIKKKYLEKLKMEYKELHDDPKTVCNCLDSLIALLELSIVTTLTPSLMAVKDEFIIPLLDSNIDEINWRVLNCLALYSILDKSLAEQYLKIICIPIIAYRDIPIPNKLPLIISVKAVCDLFLEWGANVVGGEEDNANMMNQASCSKSDDPVESNTLSPNRVQLESIIEIMLDMLDDEISEIRSICALALTKLVMGNLPVTPPFITRIVLKWYNPLTVRASDSLQHLLGVLIEYVANTVHGGRDVMAEAVIPILMSIASAPVTSPLADVDVDNLLHFLSTLTNSNDKTDLVNPHLSMAHMFCYEMMKRTNAPIVHHLSKMLLYLDVPSENYSSIKELISQVEITLLEDGIFNESSKKNVTKFLKKLKSSLKKCSRVNTLEGTVTNEGLPNSGQKNYTTKQQTKSVQSSPIHKKTNKKRKRTRAKQQKKVESNETGIDSSTDSEDVARYPKRTNKVCLHQVD